jgi:hypothetical protein
MPERAPDFAAHPLTLDEACALQVGEHCVILRIAAESHGFERVMNGLHRYKFYWPLHDGWWFQLQQLFQEEDSKRPDHH